ncbi:MAG: 2-oxoglutarate and iron-dependent oxygenase domain-containing protein, partial [Vicinamibacterales bacterium]
MNLCTRESVQAQLATTYVSLWHSFLVTTSQLSSTELPVIDVSPLVTRSRDRSRVSSEIARACRDSGFFYIVGHGVDE